MRQDKKKSNEISKKISIIFGFTFLILLILAIILILLNENSKQDLVNLCGDGTMYGTCSVSKPLFCESGILIERASICGCNEGYFANGEFCFNEFFILGKENSFKYTLDGKLGNINLIIYEGIYNYLTGLPRSIAYTEGEIPNRRDFIFLKIEDELQLNEIKKLVTEIQNIEPKSKLNQARIAISLVQNIPYASSKEKIDFAGSTVGLTKFPYQVLYDNNGSCEEKSELLALILKEIGYSSAVFYYNLENHESVGIKCPLKESLDKSGYCFVETTAPSIIGDYGGDYPGTGRLLSKPQIFILQEGLSLPTRLVEYKDAKTIMRLRDGKLALVLSKDNFLEKINKRYGLLF